MTYKNILKVAVCTAISLLTACNSGNNKPSEEGNESTIEAAPTNSICSYQGVSFYYPNTWSLRTGEMQKDLAYYIGCGEKGFSASGLISITIILHEMNLEDMMRNNIENLKAQANLKNVVVKQTEPAKFCGYDAISCDYLASITGIPFWGKIYTLNANGKTINIILQDEQNKTESTFDFFKKSFKVE